MKTKYFTKGKLPNFIFLGMLAVLVSSCGSYQSTSRDNDGIYTTRERRQVQNQQTNPQNLQYQDYFGSLTENQQEVEVFTDVDNYQSANNQQEYATGNAGWGGNSENITVNIYDNSWGYGMWNNYWYRSNWGWANQWGYNSWYGPGWGVGWNNWYNPYYGYGWNNWYGPNYGYPIYPNYYSNYNYSNNAGIRGVRNDMYGRNSARTTSGRTATPIRAGEVRSTRDNNSVRSTRTGVQNGTRIYDPNSTRSTVPSTRATQIRTATPTRYNTNDNSIERTQRQAPTRNYEAAPTRSYNPAPTRSSMPSSPTMQSGGGRSSGGNMGGSTRSSNSGGRR